MKARGKIISARAKNLRVSMQKKQDKRKKGLSDFQPSHQATMRVTGGRGNEIISEGIKRSEIAGGLYLMFLICIGILFIVV